MGAAYPEGMGTPTGIVKRAVTRLASSAKEHEAAELQQGCARLGAVLVKDLPERAWVRVAGTLRAVTLRPRAGVPALVADLYDGSGSLCLVWLGRRQIPGIEPGRSLVAEGRVTRDSEHRVIYNPRYELRPHGSE